MKQKGFSTFKGSVSIQDIIDITFISDNQPEFDFVRFQYYTLHDKDKFSVIIHIENRSLVIPPISDFNQLLREIESNIQAL